MILFTETRNETAFKQDPDEINNNYTLELAKILQYIALEQDDTVRIILENKTAYIHKEEFIRKVADELNKGKTLVSSIRSVVFAFYN